jgi:hypothetical protein
MKAFIVPAGTKYQKQGMAGMTGRSLIADARYPG